MSRKITMLLFVTLVTTLPTYGQQSSSYKVDDSTLNNGGAAEDSSLASANYRITLGAIGDPMVQLLALTSLQYQAAGGFTATFAPPGEVDGLTLTDGDTLVWSPDAAAWSYSLYRGSISGLGSSYGGCEQSDLTEPMTTDGSVPAAGDGFFYLVTARNQLGEEGLAGRDSNSLPRSPSSCP